MSTSRKYPSLLFYQHFFAFFCLFHYNNEDFIKLRKIFNSRKTIHRQFLRHCPTIEIIYISILKIAIPYFHHNRSYSFFTTSVCQLIEWNIPSLIHFSTIHNTSMSVNKSNSTLVFSKLLVLDWKKF